EQQSMELNVAKGQRLRALLGDERFGVFLQHHDGDFELNPGWPDETKPSSEIFLQLFDLKVLVAQQVAALEAVPFLVEADRRAALEVRAEQADQAAGALVPPGYYSKYLNKGGLWRHSLLESHEP